jgi:hypothetical protein
VQHSLQGCTAHERSVLRRTIDGLEDDGKYMVPLTPASRSSGNALFDFGRYDGTATNRETGMPDPDVSRLHSLL